MSNPRPKMRFAVERHASKPLSAGAWRVRLHTRVVRFEAKPFGGFVWNMPAAVSVQHVDDIGERMIPIRDETRIVQIALLAAGVLGAIMLRAAWKR